MTEIVKRIVELMNRAGDNPHSLETKAKLTNASINTWVNGKKNKKGQIKRVAPSTEAIIKIARYFGVSTDFILGLSEDNSQKNFNVSDSQVAIGNEVNGSNNTINGNNNCNTSLSDSESELLQIFRDCSEGQKLMLLGYAKTIIENK